MALLESEEAYRSWKDLLASVKGMIDMVQYSGTKEAFNRAIAPTIVQVILQFSTLRVDGENSLDLGMELEEFLAEHHGWTGQAFEHEVSAVDFLSTLKCFRVESGQMLGRGAYARVLLARNHLTGDTAVHKHVKLDSPEHGMPLHVVRELSLLQKMRHDHVVRCAFTVTRILGIVCTLPNLAKLMPQEMVAASCSMAASCQLCRLLLIRRDRSNGESCLPRS